MKSNTEADYAAGIPECCMLNLQEHRNMLLCWGLVNALENERPMDCSRCEFRRLPKPQEGSPK